MNDCYFAYGSNMNPARVAERGLAVVEARSARLPNFRLTFDKASREHVGVGHAAILWAPGEVVEGVLYELRTPAEILKMDPFERAPWNYGREVVEVSTDRGLSWSWTYFANAAVLRPGARPTAAYLAHLLAGREFLSAAYLNRLAAWPTIDSGVRESHRETAS